MSSQLIIIGKIINTHGHKGMVKIEPITDFPERFYNMEKVMVDLPKGLKIFTLDEVKEHKKFLLLKLKEINDLTEAEQLKGSYIKIEQKDLTELPKDSYYIFQLIGLKVFDMEGNCLGTITDVFETGSNDVYVVQSSDNQKPILVPALKQVVKELDIANQRMVVELLDGLV